MESNTQNIKVVLVGDPNSECTPPRPLSSFLCTDNEDGHLTTPHNKAGKTLFVRTVAALHGTEVQQDENGESRCAIELPFEFEGKRGPIKIEFSETPSLQSDYEKRIDYYSEANVVLVFFDARQAQQIDDLKTRWHLELDDLTDLNQLRILIGTHGDLPDLQTIDAENLKTLTESVALSIVDASDRDQIHNAVNMIAFEWLKEQAQIAADAKKCCIQ